MELCCVLILFALRFRFSSGQTCARARVFASCTSFVDLMCVVLQCRGRERVQLQTHVVPQVSTCIRMAK
uniref:Putative secreted protein n=1 Tax=Anopheles marajoara TaxID=58244 RepID=A0A2M4CF22_9DIPT